MHTQSINQNSSTLIRSIKGFTILELMITVVVMALVLAIGAPSFIDFIADQRIRVAASDFMGDISFARAEALKTSRRVIMAHATVAGACGAQGPIGNSWNQGWCIYVDNDGSGTFTGGDQVLKIHNGFSSGRVLICAKDGSGTAIADFANTIVFRPDGRVVRNLATVGGSDGFTISDDMGDGRNLNDKIRTIMIGATGRPALVIQNGQTNGGTAC